MTPCSNYLQLQELDAFLHALISNFQNSPDLLMDDIIRRISHPEPLGKYQYSPEVISPPIESPKDDGATSVVRSPFAAAT
jgi:hypothetical protein